jgi:hypothetical protein
LVKTDSVGTLQWEKTFGNNVYARANSVKQTTDGGYIIAGFISPYNGAPSDVYLIKTDSEGTMQWEETFGGNSADFSSAVQPTTDGGYIIVGWTYSFGVDLSDAYLIKLKGVRCESDFDCDSDVDGTDASTFKLYFGRSPLYYPCDEVNPCRGDFDCDKDVDGTDAVKFKEDFGRSEFNNPCPACVVGEWCAYP